jgi:hypothetical protein
VSADRGVDKTNAQRLIDLKAQLRSVKSGKDTITLDDCAALWGVTKPRFVNKRREIADFPGPVAVEKNAHFYPARKALRAMIAFLERHAQADVARVQRQARMLGAGISVEALAHHTPAEIVQLNRAAADIAEREREQGLYIPVAQVVQVAGEVFSEISEFLSNLSKILDPHGRLMSPSIRASLDSKAHERLLALHARMKGMLSEDVADPRARATDRQPGRARARRDSQKRMGKPAR